MALQITFCSRSLQPGHDIKGTGVFEGCSSLPASNPVESNLCTYQNLGVLLKLGHVPESLAALGVRSHHEQQNPGEASDCVGLKEMGSAIISGSDKQVIMRPNCRKTIETPKRWASLEPAPKSWAISSAFGDALGLFLR